MQKNSKAASLNYLKYHNFYYFYCRLWLGFMTSEKFESELKCKQNLKLQTIVAFLHFNKCDQNNIVSKPI